MKRAVAVAAFLLLCAAPVRADEVARLGNVLAVEQLVDVLHAEYLAESEELLHDYIEERPPAEHDNSIMWAVPRDHDGLIALMCLVGRKRL